MPRGPRGEKRPADVIGNAVKVMRIATGDPHRQSPRPRIIIAGRQAPDNAGYRRQWERRDYAQCLLRAAVLTLPFALFMTQSTIAADTPVMAQKSTHKIR